MIFKEIMCVCVLYKILMNITKHFDTLIVSSVIIFAEASNLY